MRRTRSCGSVRIISLDRDAVLERVGACAERLRAAHPEVIEVAVFGSLARCDHTGTSDVDVLVVVERSDLAEPARRILAFLPHFDLPIAVDLLVLTRAELEAGLAEGNPFLTRVRAEAVPVPDAVDAVA